MWYIYILETKKRQLYTGSTNDIARRMTEHKEGKGAKFTRAFGFRKLLYTEEHPSRSDALKREKQIQSLTRLQKLELIKEIRS